MLSEVPRPTYPTLKKKQLSYGHSCIALISSLQKYLNLMSYNKASFVLSYDSNFKFKRSCQTPFILKWLWSPEIIVSQKVFLKLFCSEIKYLPNVSPLPCVNFKFYKSFVSVLVWSYLLVWLPNKTAFNTLTHSITKTSDAMIIFLLHLNLNSFLIYDKNPFG
jgi:hypothetical protein